MADNTSLLRAAAHPMNTNGITPFAPTLMCRAEKCEYRISIGLFFDGTGNNQDGKLSPHRVAAQYRHVEDATAFVLQHGIEPFRVQRHIAAVTVETGGGLLTNERFLDQVEGLSLARPARWHELMVWRAVSKT